MNKENLQKMADHIRTVPQEMFDMDHWREDDDFESVSCNSVGCAVGHCVHLDTENKIPRDPAKGTIYFSSWASGYTGLVSWGDEFTWCFDSEWRKSDNTQEGAALRIEYLINKGLPENWAGQLNGNAPLCYLKK